MIKTIQEHLAKEHRVSSITQAVRPPFSRWTEVEVRWGRWISGGEGIGRSEIEVFQVEGHGSIDVHTWCHNICMMPTRRAWASSGEKVIKFVMSQ